MTTSKSTGPPSTRLLHAGLADEHRVFLSGARSTAFVFAPYVQSAALERLLSGMAPGIEVVVVTTWEAADLVRGASDLAVYEVVRARGGFVFLLPSLHMKLFSCDLESAIVTSANVSARALGIEREPSIECGVTVPRLDFVDRLWLRSLLQSAVLVRDEIVEALRRAVASAPPPAEAPVFDLSPHVVAQPFLLSALPMCSDPDELLNSLDSLRTGRVFEGDDELWAAALHDVALYGLRLDAPAAETRNTLLSGFRGHPFIRALDVFIEDRRYFGEVKEWLQRTCTNVPVPRRRDLTGHVRVLFDWMASIGGDLRLERPRHSECLVRVHPRT